MWLVPSSTSFPRCPYVRESARARVRACVRVRVCFVCVYTRVRVLVCVYVFFSVSLSRYLSISITPPACNLCSSAVHTKFRHLSSPLPPLPPPRAPGHRRGTDVEPHLFPLKPLTGILLYSVTEVSGRSCWAVKRNEKVCFESCWVVKRRAFRQGSSSPGRAREHRRTRSPRSPSRNCRAGAGSYHGIRRLAMGNGAYTMSRAPLAVTCQDAIRSLLNMV